MAPFLKPGKSPLELKFFRDVSLKGCVATMLNKMANQTLQWWLESTVAAPEDLSGFRRGGRTMNRISDLMISIQHERTLGNITTTVFLHIRRAFDILSHIHVSHERFSAGTARPRPALNSGLPGHQKDRHKH